MGDARKSKKLNSVEDDVRSKLALCLGKLFGNDADMWRRRRQGGYLSDARQGWADARERLPKVQAA